MKKGLIIFLAACAFALTASLAYANDVVKRSHFTSTDLITDTPTDAQLTAPGLEVAFDDVPWMYLELDQVVNTIAGHWYYDANGSGLTEEYDRAFSLPITTQTTADWKVITGTKVINKNTTYNTFWLTRLDWDTVKIADTKWWEVQDVSAYDLAGNSLNVDEFKNVHYKVGPEGGTTPVPEPISSALFLLGAGAFGLKIARKKKA